MNRSTFILLTIIFFANPAYAEQTLVFSRIQYTQDQKVAAEILKVAYKKIGFSIELIDMPGKRALKESSEGRVDGEVSRIFEVGESFPTLIRVPTPVNYIASSVFTKNMNVNIRDCSDLKNYTIGIVRGVQHAELCTKGMSNVQVVNDSYRMMKLLDGNRVDFVITAKTNGLWLAKQMGLNSVHLLSPPLNRMALYHYLNEKHKDLVVKLDSVLIEMKESGELEMLREKVMQRLLQDSINE
jgi:ABC-type amino acid transport substrate-binding protein